MENEKLVKYLKSLELSDEIITIILDNIKVKYVVPTYCYDDLLFTDLLVFENTEKFSDDNDEINDCYIRTLITKIIIDKAPLLIPSKGMFDYIKSGEEYWAIYNDLPPTNVIVDSIEKQISWNLFSYNHIYFLNKNTDKRFSFVDNKNSINNLHLFSTREEAVKFFKDKFDLN